VHGLGLATRFQALAIPAGGLVTRLLAFNLGVELGQVLCLYLLYLFGEVLVSMRRWPSIEPKLFTGLYLLSFVLMLAQL
jgi:hypothetical protein